MTETPHRQSLSAAKKTLRQTILRQRDALDPAARVAASGRITRQILNLECFQRARGVLAYASFGSEFDTHGLVSQVLTHKKLALPRVDKATRSLQLYWVTNIALDLQAGIWGIREPRPDRCAPAPLDEIDLVIAPGVAFTARGDRLGYGGGYYDELLARFAPRPAVIAAAFECQMVADLPMDASDLRVDGVVTENTCFTR